MAEPTLASLLMGYGYKPDLGSDSQGDPTTADTLAKMHRLYSGPSGVLRRAADAIPEISANDHSVMSSIFSRLGRTATALPKAGLNTAANWLSGTPEIGPDTLAPLGLAGVGGLISHGVRGVDGSAHVASPAAARNAAPAVHVSDPALKRPLYDYMPAKEAPDNRWIDPVRAENYLRALDQFETAKRDRTTLLNADNTKASLPGTIVNSMDRRVDAAGPRDRSPAAALPERGGPLVRGVDRKAAAAGERSRGPEPSLANILKGR